jgi:hypothetical protein
VSSLVICSECPATLTELQVERGNVTCSKPCGYARMRRVGSRQAAYREREATIRLDLTSLATPDGFEGVTVPLDAAVDIAMAADKAGYLRGYDNCFNNDVLRRRRRLGVTA